MFDTLPQAAKMYENNLENTPFTPPHLKVDDFIGRPHKNSTIQKKISKACTVLSF